MSDESIHVPFVASFRKGDLVHINGARWWRRYFVITEQPTATTMNIKWAWWAEPWVRWSAVVIVWGLNALVWLQR